MSARCVSLALLVSVALATPCAPLAAAELRAGTAVVDVTDPGAEKVHDPSMAKVLLLEQEGRRGVLITIDAVAIGGIGPIGDRFLVDLRSRLAREHSIPPEGVIVNASHCHAAVCADVADRVVAAVAEAKQRLVPVKAGAGTASEARISENRRVDLVDGSQADMRRAYSMPADDAIAAVAPIDPQVGLLELDRLDGSPLAVVYLFACHPIMNPPRRGTSADFPAVASRVVEEALGEGAVAFFVQGCGGDINPVRYKEVDRPADAEPLGSMLGGTVLTGLARIETSADAPLLIASELVQLPRGTDYEARIERLEAERTALVEGLSPTNISFEQFLPALVTQAVFPGDPGRSRQRTLHERAFAADGPDETAEHDRLLAAEVAAYRNNIDAMERITRLNVNLALLKSHLARRDAAAGTPLDAEIGGLRVGDFRLVTFPGELVSGVGLDVKQAAGHPTAFVAGYTNGYLHYLPTARQRANTGYAQEDCDCLVAPEWEEVFRDAAARMFLTLGAE
ncbi:MAG: hypothetical protein WCJ31_01945 [Planctomycetia bacterium]